MKILKSSFRTNSWWLYGLRSAFRITIVASLVISNQAWAAPITPSIIEYSRYVEEYSAITLHSSVNSDLTTKSDGYSWVEVKIPTPWAGNAFYWNKISGSECLPTDSNPLNATTYDRVQGKCYWRNLQALNYGEAQFRIASTDSSGSMSYSNEFTVTYKAPGDMPAVASNFITPPSQVPHNIPAMLVSKVPPRLGSNTKTQWVLEYRGGGLQDWQSVLTCAPNALNTTLSPVIYNSLLGQCEWNQVNYRGTGSGDYQFRITTRNVVSGKFAVNTPITVTAILPKAEPTTVSSAVKADQTKRAFVGYYPSWLDGPWFNSNGMSNDQVLNASQLAKVPGTYTHVMVSFAHPKFGWDGNMDVSWQSMASMGHGITGLNFTVAPKDTKKVIEVLHARNMKVFLAVGGATFNGLALTAEDWSELAAEGNAGRTGPITTALTKALTNVGFDGLDVDYELPFADKPTVDQYKGVILALRRAVDNAGAGKQLTLAAWSTGADCVAGSDLTPCSGSQSYWSGASGRERKLFTDYPELKSKFSMVSIMSYDAGYEHYLAETAFSYYRNLLPSSTILNIGLETAEEGWGGAVLTTLASAASNRRYFGGCPTSMRSPGDLPYSVDRLLQMPVTANVNAKDGGMLWHIMKKPEKEPCASIANMGSLSNFPEYTAASPRNILSKASQMYKLPIDYRANAAWH